MPLTRKGWEERDVTGPAETTRDRQSRHRPSFLRLTAGVSILRYWGVSDPFAALPQTRFDPDDVEAADEQMSRERAAQAGPARPHLERTSV